IGGGEAEVAAEMRAVHHLAADRIGPAEKPLRALELARLQRGADGGARYALPLEQHIRHGLEREALALERRKVALPLRAKAEIAPDEQPSGPQTAHQHVLDEARGAERCKACRKTDDVNALDSNGRDQLQLVAQAREPRRRRLRREEFARMRL